MQYPLLQSIQMDFPLDNLNPIGPASNMKFCLHAEIIDFVP